MQPDQLILVMTRSVDTKGPICIAAQNQVGEIIQ